LILDFFEELGGQVDTDEYDLRVDAVLRLREQINCYEDWVGGFICDYLGETGQYRDKFK
jgi:hypothetical protein